MAPPSDQRPDPSEDSNEHEDTSRAGELAPHSEPSNADIVRQATTFNAADTVRRATTFNAADIAKHAVTPDLSQVIRDAAAMPNLTRVLQDAVRVPRIQTQVLAAIRAAGIPRVAGYEAAARTLFSSLGIDVVPGLRALDIRPTDDDTAFLAIQEASPEVVGAIVRAAEIAGNPLLPARVIRNMLAGLLATLIVIAYVGGTVLFTPGAPSSSRSSVRPALPLRPRTDSSHRVPKEARTTARAMRPRTTRPIVGISELV